MSTQNTITTTKPKCQTCGRKIPTSGIRPSSIEFRRRINNIDSLEKLISSKKHLERFVKSRFRGSAKASVDRFLKELEEEIEVVDPTNPDNDVCSIKTWILNYNAVSDPEPRVYLLGIADPETPLYKFLRSNYPDINETFHDFYENYAQNVDNPLNSNHVARALSALGLKNTMKKIYQEGRIKCTMVLGATKEELAEIFRRNFGY
jgi:hypothetical protein